MTGPLFGQKNRLICLTKQQILSAGFAGTKLNTKGWWCNPVAMFLLWNQSSCLFIFTHLFTVGFALRHNNMQFLYSCLPERFKGFPAFVVFSAFEFGILGGNYCLTVSNQLFLYRSSCCICVFTSWAACMVYSELTICFLYIATWLFPVKFGSPWSSWSHAFLSVQRFTYVQAELYTFYVNWSQMMYQATKMYDVSYGTTQLHRVE